jgi:archaemetzincin
LPFSSIAPFAVQPIGPVDEVALEQLARVIGGDFGARVSCLAPIDVPPEALRPERRQVDADVLLDDLFARLPERCLRVVGVTDCDLYVTGRTFVFGYAHLTDGMALYSVHRLREDFYGRARDRELEQARVRRALLHEVGHTFGAPHCDDRDCAMHAVTHIETLDALSPELCGPCALRVRDGCAVAPWSARGRFERGMACFRRRQFARAVGHLLHAVRSAPLDARYRQALELARAALGGGGRAVSEVGA